MSILQKLTEGVVSRDMRKEGAALLNKWEQTGLLEGLQGDVEKNNMARLLGEPSKAASQRGSIINARWRCRRFRCCCFPNCPSCIRWSYCK